MVTVILSIALLMYPANQAVRPARLIQQDGGLTASACSQPEAERDSLIREAEENQYWVRRVEFLGNEYTRDQVLRRRILLVEGDVFTRENLMRSLVRVSQLKKIIHPVRPGDVIVSLDRPEKIIDVAICFKERRRPHRGGRRVSGKRAS